MTTTQTSSSSSYEILQTEIEYLQQKKAEYESNLLYYMQGKDKVESDQAEYELEYGSHVKSKNKYYKEKIASINERIQEFSCQLQSIEHIINTRLHPALQYLEQTGGIVENHEVHQIVIDASHAQFERAMEHMSFD
jgi:prefoldin subunit 5